MNLFRYSGGKSKKAVRELITAHFPKQIEEFRDPFVGGGGIPLNMPFGASLWLNDLNPHLVAVYLALRDRPKSFIKSCRDISPVQVGEPTFRSKQGCRYSQRLHRLFWEAANDEKMDSALRFFILNRMGFNGRVMLDPPRRKRMFFSNPDGWNITTGDVLERSALALSNARITCCDFEQLFLEKGQGVLVSADPPYVRDSELSESAKLYEFGFSFADHQRLRDVAFKSPHRVCLTYDDHPLVRKLYDGWYFHPVSWHYCGTIENRRRGHELIITNYPTKCGALAMAA